MHPNDRHSSFDMDEAPSRPIVRPPSVHRTQSGSEFSPTPLEDVREYEPLFDEEVKKEKERAAAAEGKARHYFPSKDIWEDAPNSVHYTVEVSTPESEDVAHRRKSSTHQEGRPITPAQAFAQYQEELAEREAKRRSNSFLTLSADHPQKPPTWIDHHPHLGVPKSSSSRRFPSKDVWEDTPDSHIQETVLSGSPPKDDQQPDIPARPAKKSSDVSQPPAVPDRPKPRQLSGDDGPKQPPPISDKPKPQIPMRPAKKLSGDSKEGEAVKPPKPPVPSRPVGGKIAALQAGFMSDLNKRLQLGPQGQKKEEASPEQEAVEEKEKKPLSDARKGRARGPQRRAPAKVAPAVVAPAAAVHTLAISGPHNFWSIDPEDGSFTVAEPKQSELVAAVDTPAAKPAERLAPEEKKDSVDEPEPEPAKEVKREKSEVEESLEGLAVQGEDEKMPSPGPAVEPEEEPKKPAEEEKPIQVELEEPADVKDEPSTLPLKEVASPEKANEPEQETAVIEAEEALADKKADETA